MPLRLEQRSRRAWAVTCLAAQRFLRIDGTQWAGSFAFNAFFSLFPLMLLFVTLAWFFVDRESAGRAIVTYVEGYVPLDGAMQARIFGAIAEVIQARGQAGVVALLILVPLLVLFLSLTSVYRLAPRRATRFAEVWVAAACATVLLQTTESLFVVYLKHFAALNAVYGMFGGIMALLLWIYLSGCGFIFGACLCAVQAEGHRSDPKESVRVQRPAYRFGKRLLQAVLLGAVCGAMTSTVAAQEPVGRAEQPPNLGTPGKEDLSPAPAKVDVKPVARDEEIRKRLQSVLDATGWFTDPRVEVREGVVFLNGRAETDELKKWAGDLARNTQDVVAVANRMEVLEPSVWDFSPAWSGLLRPLARLHPLAPLLPFRAAHPGAVGRGRRAGDPRSAGVPSPKGPSESPAQRDRCGEWACWSSSSASTSFCESPA